MHKQHSYLIPGYDDLLEVHIHILGLVGLLTLMVEVVVSVYDDRDHTNIQ